MIFVLLALLLGFIIIDLILNREILSPGFLFNGIFFITLLLYIFYLSDIQQVLSYRLILTFIFSVLAYNIPVLMYSIIKFFEKDLCNTKVNIDKVEEKTEKDTDKKNILSMSKTKELVIFLIVLVIFLVEVIYNKGFPLLWKIIKTGKVYVDFGFPILHGFFISLVSLIGSYSLFKKKCYYKWFYLIIGILIINRNIIMTILVQGFVFYLLQNKDFFKKRRNLYFFIVSIIVVFLFFSIIGNIRTGESEFLRVSMFKAQYSWIPTSFKWIYSYMCFSISNLNNLFSMTKGGIYHGLLSIIDIFPSVISNNIKINPFEDYLVSQYFNVSTSMANLYLDFGIIGIILFFLLLGLLMIYIYNKVEKGNEYCYLVYMILSYCIIFIFFVNMLFSSPVYFQFVLIPILFFDYSKFKKKKSSASVIEK